MTEASRSKPDHEPQPFSVGGDLHAHISGSINDFSIYDLILQNGLNISHRDQINSITESFGLRLADTIENNPDQAKEQFALAYSCPPNGRNRFEEVMQRFNLTSFLLQLPGIKSQVGEVVAKDFKKNGVTYVEWRVDPFSGTQHESAEEGFEKLSEYYSGMKRVDLNSRFILSVSKSRYRNSEGVDRKKIEFLREQVKKLLILGRELPIVGLDVSGAESVALSAFKPYFDLARVHSLGITPHVGEGTTPSLEEGLIDVETALDFQAKRLGHAIVTYMPLDNYLGREDGYGKTYDATRVRSLKEKQKEIVDRIRNARIPIEVCPTSNLSAHLGLRSYKEHPIDRLIELGISYVICSDDSGIFGRTLRQEINELARAKNLNVKQVIEESRKHAFSR